MEGTAHHDSSASPTALARCNHGIRRRNRSVLANDNAIWPAGPGCRSVSLCGRPRGYVVACGVGIAFAGAAIGASVNANGTHDLMLSWAAFFALALCIGEIVAAKSSGSVRADAVQAMRIIESMPAHTWSANPDGHVTYVSAGTLSYIGELADKAGLFHLLDNAAWRRVIHPDDYARVMEIRRHSLVTGVPFDAEYRVRRWDGTYRWFRSFGTLSRDDQGEVAGWYGTMIDIDEQKQAETALRERERELSQLVNIVPVHIRRLTPQGEPIFFNKRLTDFFGLDVTDLGKPGTGRMATAITNLVHPDDSANLLKTVRHSLTTGESYSMKYRMRRADGAYRWVDGRAEPVRDESGAIVQWYAISIDIEDEVHAQQALLASERSLQQLIDTVPVLIWCLSPDGLPTYFNKRMVEYTGVSVEQLGPPTPTRFIAVAKAIMHPDDAIAVTTAVQGAVTTRRSLLVEASPSPFGRRVSLGGRARRADARCRRRHRAVVWRLFRHRRARCTPKRALRQSERQLQQLIDAVPALIWSTTRDGTPTYVNKRFTDVIGATLEDITAPDGSPSLSVIHPDDRDASMQAIAPLIRDGRPLCHEISPAPARWHLSLDRDPRGSVARRGGQHPPVVRRERRHRRPDDGTGGAAGERAFALAAR